MVPAEQRLPEARPLVEQGHYLVVHAPRQMGKTTALHALTRELSAAAVGDDYAATELIVLSAIREAALAEDLALDLQPPDPGPSVYLSLDLGSISHPALIFPASPDSSA